MPVLKGRNGKWRIGSGPAIYKTRASAERAYRGYLYSEHGVPRKKKKKHR